MSRIFTVTANTAIDHCIEVDQITLEKAVLAKSNIEYAAGKGVNVAKTLESLNVQVCCLGFVGDLSLNKFNALGSEMLKTDFTVVAGQTRSNITLIDTLNQQMHIRTNGYNITTNDCERLTKRLEVNIAEDDIVIFSGSLPPGALINTLQNWIELCHEKSATVILDSSGESLLHGIQARPYLIKPNVNELEEISGQTLKKESEIISAAKQLQEKGVQIVFVSRGERGVIVVSEQAAYVACVSVDQPIVSNIGCGDALVAGLAVSIKNKWGLPEAIKFALCCATANLFTREPGRITLSHFEMLKKQIVVRSL